MSSLFIRRNAEVILPKGTLRPSEKAIRAPHVTLYHTNDIDAKGIDLATIAIATRRALESSRSPLDVKPKTVGIVGQKLAHVSVALMLEGDVLDSEIAYYHQEFGRHENIMPHITLVKDVPAEDSEEVRERLRESVDFNRPIRLSPVRTTISELSLQRLPESA